MMIWPASLSTFVTAFSFHCACVSSIHRPWQLRKNIHWAAIWWCRLVLLRRSLLHGLLRHFCNFRRWRSSIWYAFHSASSATETGRRHCSPHGNSACCSRCIAHSIHLVWTLTLRWMIWEHPVGSETFGQYEDVLILDPIITFQTWAFGPAFWGWRYAARIPAALSLRLMSEAVRAVFSSPDIDIMYTNSFQVWSRMDEGQSWEKHSGAQGSKNDQVREQRSYHCSCVQSPFERRCTLDLVNRRLGLCHWTPRPVQAAAC